MGPTHRLDHSLYQLEFDERFEGETLDPERWIPHYLPQWSTLERTAARYRLESGRLSLAIEADQLPWCPYLDGELRVSSIQTGVFAGAKGSRIGQHRFDPAVVVRTEQHNRALYTPRYGLVEVSARVLDDPRSMVAIWLIGYEDEPERSAELCIAEIFGRDVRPDSLKIGTGHRPWGDPSIVDDFETITVDLDASAPHTFAAAWRPGRAEWFVDGRRIRSADQAPAYPMQLMLGLYEFPVDVPQQAMVDEYPKTLEVERVRGYSLRDGWADQA